MRDRVNILGVSVDNLTMEQAIDRLTQMAKEDRVHTVFTPNSEIIYMAKNDKNLRRILNESDLNTADGIGVVYAGKILGTPIKERVTGYDMALRFLPVMEKEGLTLFLFGSVEGVAVEAKENLLKLHPNLKIVGTRNGYFDDEEAVVAEINQAKPDVVFVCLGAPKQEKFIAKYKEKWNAKLLFGIGGSLDGFAGRVKRAPDFFINAHLEWFYRLLKNPSRIGRMMALPKFAFAVLRSQKKGGTDND